MMPPWMQGNRPRFPGIGTGATPELETPPLPPSPIAGLTAARVPRPPTMAPPSLETGMEGEGLGLRGGMSYSGPQLNTESALSGLRSASQALRPELLPDSELFRLANRPTMAPGGHNDFFGSYGPLPTSAPGSNAYWANMLDARQAEDKGMRDFERGQTQTVQGAITAGHPAIQTALESQARRAAYPQQVAGQADIEAAQIGAAGRMGAAQLTAGGRRSTRDASVAAQALRNLITIQNPLQGETTESESYKQRVAQALQILDMIRQGGFFDEEEDPYAMYDEEPY